MNKLLLVIALMLLAMSPMSAQKDEKLVERKEAEELVRQVISLYRSGKYNEALPLAEKAIILSESATGPISDLTAASLRNLAEIQFARRKNKDAEVSYDRYLTVYEKVVGENDPQFISSLDRYVCMLVTFEPRSKALEIQKRIYKLDNKFDFADTGRPMTKNMEKAGLSAGNGDKLPPPNYSSEAKLLGVSGSVVYKVETNETGAVTNVKTLCGHPLLVKGSEPAIRQSKFKPTIVAGNPVKATFIAIYNFVL